MVNSNRNPEWFRWWPSWPCSSSSPWSSSGSLLLSLSASPPRCYGDKTNGSPMVSNTTKQQTKWIVFVFGRLLILLSISLHWSRQSICLCFWQNTLGPIGGNQCQKISWWVVLLPLFLRIFWIFFYQTYGFVMMTSTTKEQTKFRTLHHTIVVLYLQHKSSSHLHCTMQ